MNALASIAKEFVDRAIRDEENCIKEMMEHKPLPSVEASLKYMAWDMKRVANELEKLNKTLESRGHSVNDQEVPF